MWNSNCTSRIEVSGIVEHISHTSEDHVAPANPPQHEAKAAKRLSSFTYYIHDTVETFRLQLLGELTEAEVEELKGCWRTAKSTLGNRKLLLDLRRLKSVDDAGKQWLAVMSTEGACYLPETYLKTCLAGQGGSPDDSEKSARKSNLLGRLVGALRGLRVTAAESSTPAP